MKISVKTLKGEQFQIDVEPSVQIAAVKEAIAATKPELPAARQKLIHSGKVLKDTQVLSETGIAENEFLVCMVTKEAKPKAQAQSAPAPTATAQVSSPAPQVTQPTTTTTAAPPAATTTTAPTTPAAQTQQQAPPAPSRETTINPEAVRQLMDMGFPEEEATTALRAAMGNADVAVEFLMNGIPAHAMAAAGMGGGGDQSMADQSMDVAEGGGGGIEQLRAHPQLNELRRVVQSNPSALSQVLEAIGQQNPELLQLIHANQAEFLAMMNEPITEQQAPTPQQGVPGAGAGGMQIPPANMPGGEPNPMQLIQMIQMLPEEQRAAAAQSLGMSPEQLQQFSQMIAQLPPDQLQQLMGQAGAMGGGGGMGGAPAGQNVIRLTEEEMNAVNRLTEMGFDQQDAVAAYMACDKNEAMAANLLLEGWNADEGGGY